MAIKRLEELLGKITQGNWEGEQTQDLMVWVVNDNSEDPNERVIASVETTNPHDGVLLALAPSLARRVIAAEKIISAYTELLATVKGECSDLLDPSRGGSDVLYNLVGDAEDAIAVYNEACK